MENLNKAIIAEITGLAIDIQNAGIGTVFVNFSGHVSKMYVHIHSGGWQTNRNADISLEIDLLENGYAGDVTPSQAIQQLTALLTPANA